MASEVRIVAASARKILPDCVYDCEFQALIPIYRLRFIGLVQTTAKMSSPARFVLQAISLGTDRISSLGKLLGLEQDDVGRAAAELRSLRLLEAHNGIGTNDVSFTVTNEGKRVVEENRRLFKLAKRSLQVDYSPLTGDLQLYGDSILTLDEARKLGDFVEPVRKKKPRVSDINIDQLSKIMSAEGRIPDDAELVGIAKMDEPYVCYQQITVAVLEHIENLEQRVLVFWGRNYLAKESQELQSLMVAGKQVIQPGLAQRRRTAPALPGATIEERQSIENIQRLEEETDDIETAIDANKSLSPGDVDENVGIPSPPDRVVELEQALANKSRELEEMEQRLTTQSKGKAHHVRTHDHRTLLVRALKEAKEKVLIVVPWVKNLDSELQKEFSECLNRGVMVTIIWGLGTKFGKDREQTKAKSKRDLDKLRSLAKAIPQSKLNVIENETHEKLLFCDLKFGVIGSYNWLSADAHPNNKESSLYTERPEDISSLLEEYRNLYC